MLSIMEIAAQPDGGHRLQAQSHRTECWLEGWVAVPPDLEETIWACGGYGTPEILDGVLTGFTPGQSPQPVQPEHTLQDDVDAMLVDHEYRLTLLELGVN
ncbi:toxin-antitoxin system toxin subunit [Flavonifractor hominis]|uniref:Toxin-antitoxin system toxin subunit n=1 Tax=Flavonifractor hominis TaxID=3133178 RepID=A0ABV1EQL4_9FIRM